jgi:hypothetical protein
MDLKFSLIRCSEVQKSLFAVQQLHGPASTWWASFLAMQPAGYPIPWADFCTALRREYIPDEERHVGKEQFVKLQQGDQSVREFQKQFSYLSQFAPEYVSTDADKKFWFVHGLDMELQKL